jgi:hypothetical protein
LSDFDRDAFRRLVAQLPSGFTPAPRVLSTDKTLNFVSPH